MDSIKKPRKNLLTGKWRMSGAALARYALEQLPISHTFGIPGVHNTELYDELHKSESITPVLVTHEGAGAFMADGVSRTSDQIGTMLIVPAAGVTQAMSGISEAFLDGSPMLIISGGTRRDVDFRYQLHEWDQHAVLAPTTKKTFLITAHDQIVSTIFTAYQIATTGVPGPVFIEIPVDIQLFTDTLTELPTFQPLARLTETILDKEQIKKAVSLLQQAKAPGLFLGWGAKEATAAAIELAELLETPVSVTLQGLSVFPGNHPLYVGMGFGNYSVPAAENAFKGCDCLIAIGTRFGEIPTGSFGMVVPENLIHIDIDPTVFHKNFPAKVTIEADAAEALPVLVAALKKAAVAPSRPVGPLRAQIVKDRDAYFAEWYKADVPDRVNPARFFVSLRKQLADDAILVVDDGNHTFLTEELFFSYQSKHMISPTDFNCMGFAVPAAIGAKLVNPKKQVATIVGDGAFMMTCMEIVTAVTQKTGVIFFVFNDGELSQIAQGQEIPYNRKTCTILGQVNFEGVAMATGAAYLKMSTNEDIEATIKDALQLTAAGHPVIVNVIIDYAKRTRFTKGVVGTVLKRFNIREKTRFISRAIKRKVTG